MKSLNSPIEELIELRTLHGEEFWWYYADNKAFKFFQESAHWNFPDLLSSMIKEKNTVVQAGGHCGMYAKKYSKKFDNVYTFEPNRINFYCLNLNATAPNIFKFQACLGDKNRSVSFWSSKNNSGSHHIDITQDYGNTPMLTIDNLGLNSCSLIHLDLEGYEYYAIQGAAETITTFKPLICLETTHVTEINTNITIDQLDKLMDDLNYLIHIRDGHDTIYIPKN